MMSVGRLAASAPCSTGFVVRTVLRLPDVRHKVGRQEQASKMGHVAAKAPEGNLKPFQTTLSGATSIVLIQQSAAAAISGASESLGCCSHGGSGVCIFGQSAQADHRSTHEARSLSPAPGHQHGQEEGHSVHRDAGVHRGADRGRHPVPIRHTKGGGLCCALAHAHGSQPSLVHACGLYACQHIVPNAMSTHADYCSCGAQNRKNTSARLELRKYNKFLRRITLHREIK